MSTRARGTLSKIKTQRLPHSAGERQSEIGGVYFVVLLFLYLSFSRARRQPVKVAKGWSAKVV